MICPQEVKAYIGYNTDIYKSQYARLTKFCTKINKNNVPILTYNENFPPFNLNPYEYILYMQKFEILRIGTYF